MTQTRTYVTFLSLIAEWDRETIKERRNDSSKNNKDVKGVVGHLYKYDTTVKMDSLLFIQRSINYNTSFYPRVLDFCNGVKKSSFETPLEFLAKHAFYGISDKEYLGDDRDKVLSLRVSGEFSYQQHDNHTVEQKEPLFAVPNIIDKNGDLNLYDWKDNESPDRKIVFVWVPEHVYVKALNIHIHNNSSFKKIVKERLEECKSNDDVNHNYPEQVGVLDILVYYSAYEKEICATTNNIPVKFSKSMFGKKVKDAVKKSTKNFPSDDVIEKLKNKFIETFSYAPNATSTSGGKGGLASGITLQFK